jgi:hypothetical protein
MEESGDAFFSALVASIEKEHIKGWVGLAPAVYVIVAANQWGMKLAASKKALFVKAWTLAPVSFQPFALAAVMPTKKY